jgi:hypothetical protein
MADPEVVRWEYHLIYLLGLMDVEPSKKHAASVKVIFTEYTSNMTAMRILSSVFSQMVMTMICGRYGCEHWCEGIADTCVSYKLRTGCASAESQLK